MRKFFLNVTLNYVEKSASSRAESKEAVVNLKKDFKTQAEAQRRRGMV